jgi:uncharacterized protein (DUF488 family)
MPRTGRGPGRRAARPAPSAVYTVGHSTRAISELVGLLQAHGIQQVVDVRTIPRSRHNPHFNGPRLSRSLRAAGIGYRHLKALGGLRRARADSRNLGWHNASFRGYADYMQTDDFAAGLARLEELATRRPTAIMCAEAVPWRCHRSLIADALKARGWEVRHIIGTSAPKEHEFTPFAHVKNGKVVYPSPEK